MIIHSKSAEKSQLDAFANFCPTLISDLEFRGGKKVKLLGIVVKSFLKDSFLDVKICDGTGAIECSVFIEKKFKDLYMIPKVGEILHVFGAYDKKMVGPRTFTKIKVYRYKAIRNLEKFQVEMSKLLEERLKNEVEVIHEPKKRVATLRKISDIEARTLVFITPLEILKTNLEFKQLTFSRNTLKNQSVAKKFISERRIKLDFDDALDIALQYFSQKEVIEAIPRSQMQNKTNKPLMYKICRSFYSSIQDYIMQTIVRCGLTGINYTYMVELIHKRLNITQEDDHIFSIEGLYRLVDPMIKDGKVFTHKERLLIV